jgi:hypothetical protein
MQFQGLTFRDDTIELDGDEYDGCRFENCTLVYRGGPLPTLADCSFSRSSIALEGAAAATLSFLHALYHRGFQVMVEQTFAAIRTDDPAPGEAEEASRPLSKSPVTE